MGEGEGAVYRGSNPVIAPCPRCGQRSSLQFRAADRNRRTSGEAFDYYRCSACGIVFLSPLPADLSKYYPQDYYGIPPSLKALPEAAAPERYKIDIVRRFAASGRLLEIGPAYGSFAYLAKEAGFAVDTIEMDEACCRFMTQMGIHAIHHADTNAALRASGPYDVIALWHVIEHLPDPWSTLQVIVERLKPGGLIVIAAPNPLAFQFRLLGRLWTHLDAPRHVELIPSSLLSRHLQQLGVAPLAITTNDPGGLGWNVFGWEMSFASFSANPAIRLGLRLAGRLASLLAAPLDRIEGNGSAYTALFRKGPSA